jgi:hypothetical protein
MNRERLRPVHCASDVGLALRLDPRWYWEDLPISELPRQMPPLFLFAVTIGTYWGTVGLLIVHNRVWHGRWSSDLKRAASMQLPLAHMPVPRRGGLRQPVLTDLRHLIGFLWAERTCPLANNVHPETC